MTLKNAPAKDVLMALARIGGYGFVFVDDSPAAGGSGGGGGVAAAERRVSIAFRNESYGRAINSALLAAGLQGKVEGNLILAGPNALGKSFGPQMSKVYRLNQASADSAADYLANLGAQVTKTFVTTSVSQSTQSSGTPTQNTGATQSQTATITQIQSYGASQGPLRGLIGTSDSRLGTITLVGDPRVVAVAESYLRQLDLRQRQVALSVKILDVTLDNDQSIDNSFAFRYGNNFIVSERGQLVGAFGSLLPPLNGQFEAISQGGSAPVNPGSAYVRDNFYDFVKAKIESRTTKVLASPTLILSENSEELRKGQDLAVFNQQLSQSPGSSGGGSGGSTGDATIGRTRANESYVTVGEQLITNYNVQAGQNGAPNTCQPEFGIAGLTFGARISKIDDNGFVTFSMSPTISAAVRTIEIPNCGPVDILAIRSLDTGSARVRDGQTLIMTGVISDRDNQVVRKWPVLGDLPLVGQFFRNTAGTRGKRELVIMVTPRIINDVEGGTFGYGWQPGTPQSRELMRNVRP
jgi:type IV pilus assembly protein PilQ